MKKHFNYFLFFTVTFLLLFSLIFFASLSAPASLQDFGNSTHYLLRQIAYCVAGIFFGFIAFKIPLKYFKQYAPIVLAINLVCLFLVFIPVIGSKLNGASRWISIGPIGFQPSEFLKITAILYLSAWIASKLAESHTSDWKNTIKSGYHNIIYILIPFIVFLGVIGGALILQRDVSTLGIITLTLLALYFSSRTPLWHTLFIVFVGVCILLLLVRFEPYRLDRFLVFLHPDRDPLGKAYQLKQSLISLGSGGIFGRGLGMSTQKFGFLPAAISDSIFAIIGEELGIVGCSLVIGGFITFMWSGLQIAKRSNDRFGKMVAIGVVTWISLQAFINIASVAGIFPYAGIPLPFFSYGGSHIVVELFSIGLLLNVSKNT